MSFHEHHPHSQGTVTVKAATSADNSSSLSTKLCIPAKPTAAHTRCSRTMHRTHVAQASGTGSIPQPTERPCQTEGARPELRAAATSFSRFSRRNCAEWYEISCAAKSACTLVPSRKQPHAKRFSFSCLPGTTNSGCSACRSAGTASSSPCTRSMNGPYHTANAVRITCCETSPFPPQRLGVPLSVSGRRCKVVPHGQDTTGAGGGTRRGRRVAAPWSWRRAGSSAARGSSCRRGRRGTALARRARR